MKIKIISLVLFFGMFSSVYPRDIVSEFMKGKVATFMDAASLLYYSFQSVASQKKDKENKKSPEEIRKFLKEKGIQVSLDSRPITRKEFAKTLIERFNLETSYLTDIFGGLDNYFQDAVNLGIFEKNDRGNENLTTKELLSAYLRAEKLSRRKSY